MAYNYSRGQQVIGDLAAADDIQRDTKIDFGEDQIEFHTSGSVRLTIDNGGVELSNGELSFGDIILAELSIPGVDLQTDTNAFRFNCPYGLTVTGLGLALDQHTTSGNVTVTVTNTTDTNTMITFSLTGTGLGGNTTTVSNASCDAGDVITFAITATPANAQGLRATLFFRRNI